jgi:exonuclease SbcD
MKILHTADIHLITHEDERWNALSYLIEIGKREKIDLFIISGDLFDRGVSAEKLRVKVRNLFSNTGFQIIILPGNHDMDVYKPGLNFGREVIILKEKPFDLKSTRIIGIPFLDIEGEELLRRINSVKELISTQKKNILLFHGELLDTFYSRSDFGKEGRKRYMPVKLSYFSELKIEYILAGHFHTNFDVHNLKQGGYFVYPGSPISITKREIGTRMVNLFEIGSPPTEYPLETPFYERVIIELDPFTQEDPISSLETRLQSVPKNGKLLLTVRGFFNGSISGFTEETLDEKIRAIAHRYGEREPEMEFQDIKEILEDDLFTQFLEKLKRKEYDDTSKKQMRNIAIQAMIERRR